MDSMHRAPIGDPGRDSRLSSFTHRLPAATQCTATGIAPVASAATTARDRYFPCAAGHSATLDPPPLTSARFAPSAMASPAHCSSTSLRIPSCALPWSLRRVAHPSGSSAPNFQFGQCSRTASQLRKLRSAVCATAAPSGTRADPDCPHASPARHALPAPARCSHVSPLFFPSGAASPDLSSLALLTAFHRISASPRCPKLLLGQRSRTATQLRTLRFAVSWRQLSPPTLPSLLRTPLVPPHCLFG